MVSLSFFFTVKINDICFIIILMCSQGDKDCVADGHPKDLQHLARVCRCKPLMRQLLQCSSLSIKRAGSRSSIIHDGI